MSPCSETLPLCVGCDRLLPLGPRRILILTIIMLIGTSCRFSKLQKNIVLVLKYLLKCFLHFSAIELRLARNID